MRVEHYDSQRRIESRADRVRCIAPLYEIQTGTRSGRVVTAPAKRHREAGECDMILQDEASQTFNFLTIARRERS